MAEAYLRQDALAHRALLARGAAITDDPGVRPSLEGPRTQLALRGDGASPAFAGAVRAVTGAQLPLTPNRACRGAAASALWMGPDEWLLVASEGLAPALHPALEEALAGQHSLVSDVSSSRVILGLGGAHATEILAKGCSIDLHPRVFGVDHVVQSALARAHAMIHAVDARPTYHLYVHRSFADYVFGWLEDAASEYGLAPGA